MSNEALTFIIIKILNCYKLVDIALSDLCLYKATILVLVYFIIYIVYYAWIIDKYHIYIDAIIDALYNSLLDIIESTKENSAFGAFFIKNITLSTLFICAVLHIAYLYTSNIAFINVLQIINSVTLFYIFWAFFILFCENLKILLEHKADIPFSLIYYLIDGKTYNFFWNKIYKTVNSFNNFLIDNINAHYAFVWSFFFCVIYVSWLKIPMNYMIECYLGVFISAIFINLIFAILFSGSSNVKVSAFFINQLLYIMIGAFFLLYISNKWYNPLCIKNVNLGGYFLLSNSAFYFKTWIIFFFMLCLILANAYVRQSINSLVELSILFSAAIPILFIIIGLVDIFAIVLSFEVLSLVIIGLCGLTMNSISTEASIKYFCQNTIITGLTVFGVFFYLFIFKNTNLLLTQSFIELLYETKLLTYFFRVLLFSSIILWLLSFMFKFGIFPVNFYVADIYNGSSAPAILFISSVIKPTVLFIFSTKIIPLFSSQIIIISLISCFCVSSIILGDWMSLNSHNLKRFFGHSSVSQYGFLLLAIFSQSKDVLFYAFMYSFIYNISIFIIFIIIIEHRSFDLVDLSNLFFNDLNLYFSYNLSLKLLITVCFLSISGVPPFILFIFKYLLFVQIFSFENYVFLLLIFVFNVGVSSAYYFKIINDIWFVNTSNSNFNSLSEKKSLIFRDKLITRNSIVYIFWFIIVVLSYVIFVHFDSLYNFVTISVFSDLNFSVNMIGLNF